MNTSNFFPGVRLSFPMTVVAILVTLTALTEPSLAQQIYSATSGYSACAIDAKGNLYAWGCDNYYHTVVSARAPQDLTPVEIPFPNGVTKWKSAAVGAYYTLAIGNDGNIYAWGYNHYGELGDGDTASSNTLVKVSMPNGVTTWTAIAAGDSFNLALGNDGNLYAWGANSQGQLGDDSTVNSATPVKVSLPAGVKAIAIAAGEQFGAAIGSDDTIYVWGTNDNGQLGTGSSTPKYSAAPLAVSLPGGVTPKSISTGRSYCLVVGSDGNIYGWGGNTSGQLANSTTFGTLAYSPVVVSKPAGVTSWKMAVGGGEGFSLGIGSDGKLYAWGYNGLGELGIGSTTATKAGSDTAHAVKLSPGVTPEDVALGDYSDYAIGNPGDTVYAWGYNQQGQLGINNTVLDKLTPVEVLGVGGTGYLTLSAGPAAPALVSPNDTTGIPRKATIIWNSVPGATSYELQVSTGIQFYFSSLAVDTSLTDTSATVSAPLIADTKYYWRVVASTSTLTGPYSVVDSFTTGSGIDAITNPVQVPKDFALFQNYPNPFNPTTNIEFRITNVGFVTLKVYDVLGTRVATLVNKVEQPGIYQVRFNGSRLASGVYFYRLDAGGAAIERKMVMVK